MGWQLRGAAGRIRGMRSRHRVTGPGLRTNEGTLDQTTVGSRHPSPRQRRGKPFLDARSSRLARASRVSQTYGGDRRRLSSTHPLPRHQDSRLLSHLRSGASRGHHVRQPLEVVRRPRHHEAQLRLGFSRRDAATQTNPLQRRTSTLDCASEYRSCDQAPTPTA